MKGNLKMSLLNKFRKYQKIVKRNKFSKKNIIFQIKMVSFLVRVHLHKVNMNLIRIKVKEQVSLFFIKIPSKMIISILQEKLQKEQMVKNISLLSIVSPLHMIFYPRSTQKIFFSQVKENKRPMISSLFTLRISLLEENYKVRVI